MGADSEAMAMNVVATVGLWAAVVAAVVASVSKRGRIGLPIAAAVLWVDVVWLASRLAALDLSLVYVVDYARAGVSPATRIAGLWGGPSGSLLLFAAGTATVAAVVRPTRSFPVRMLALSVAVLAATVAIDSPFRTLAIPAISGGGMQPILEHWAMLIHPPTLYLGLVVAAGVWAHAVGGSPPGRVRLWALATFVALTIGQLLGSNWAYLELGWGGYWAWDPVENGIAVAWFVLVAALHTTRLSTVATRGIAAGAWVAVLFAAFVTRSGGGGSVHAFADDPLTGAILGVLVIATIAATVFGVRRFPGTDNRSDISLDRRAVIVAASLAAAVVVVIGLLFPVLAPGDQVVNGTYFARLIAPLGIIAVAGVGLSFLMWIGRGTRFVIIAAGFAGAEIGAVLGARGTFSRFMAVSVGVSLAGLIVGNVQRRQTGERVRWDVILAHLGVIVMGVGVAGTTQGAHTNFALKPGESFTTSGVVFEHRTVTASSENDVDRLTATLVVVDGGQRTEVSPSVQSFPQRGVVLAETAVISRPQRDIVIVMAGATELGLARYEVTVTPLMQFVWWGAALIGIGSAAAAGRAYFSRDRRRWANKASRVADSAR